MAAKKKSPIQEQIRSLEEKAEILEKIVNVAKTSGGRISDDGKNLIHILRSAGLNKSEIASIIDVTPAALTPYD
jgi:CRISPR/Cas system CSM-associated protein Csm2 small subunit